MAQININNIEKIEKTRNYVHEIVNATYTVFECDEKRYMQIDTYGREEREIPGKISQSIQLDRDMAQYIINLLKQEFDL